MSAAEGSVLIRSFLHHEEVCHCSQEVRADPQLYHSTPETQTDESYIHPEDIEHFRRESHRRLCMPPC